MTWVQRLKRVFHIDLETCQVCDGALVAFPRSGPDQFGDTIAPMFDDHYNPGGGVLSFINSIPGTFSYLE